MIFYTLLDQENDDVVGDVIVFDDGVVVVKYEDCKFPDVYNSLDDLINNMSIEHYLIKDEVKEV
jgi:hypothetical protein